MSTVRYFRKQAQSSDPGVPLPMLRESRAQAMSVSRQMTRVGWGGVRGQRSIMPAEKKESQKGQGDQGSGTPQQQQEKYQEKKSYTQASKVIYE